MKKIKKILSITLAMILIFTATAAVPKPSLRLRRTAKKHSRNSLQVVKPHSRLLPAAKQ